MQDEALGSPCGVNFVLDSLAAGQKGDVEAPAITFVDDVKTGFYLNKEGEMRVSVDGEKAVTFGRDYVETKKGLLISPSEPIDIHAGKGLLYKKADDINLYWRTDAGDDICVTTKVTLNAADEILVRRLVDEKMVPLYDIQKKLASVATDKKFEEQLFVLANADKTLEEKLVLLDSKLTSRIDADIAAVDSKLTSQIGADIAAVDSKLTSQISADIAAVDSKLTTQISADIAAVNGKLEAIDGKLTSKISADIAAVDSKLTSKINSCLDDISTKSGFQINTRVSQLSATVGAQVAGIDARVSQLSAAIDAQLSAAINAQLSTHIADVSAATAAQLAAVQQQTLEAHAADMAKIRDECAQRHTSSIDSLNENFGMKLSEVISSEERLRETTVDIEQAIEHTKNELGVVKKNIDEITGRLSDDVNDRVHNMAKLVKVQCDVDIAASSSALKTQIDREIQQLRDELTALRADAEARKQEINKTLDDLRAPPVHTITAEQPVDDVKSASSAIAIARRVSEGLKNFTAMAQALKDDEEQFANVEAAASVEASSAPASADVEVSSVPASVNVETVVEPVSADVEVIPAPVSADVEVSSVPVSADVETVVEPASPAPVCDTKTTASISEQCARIEKTIDASMEDKLASIRMRLSELEFLTKNLEQHKHAEFDADNFTKTIEEKVDAKLSSYEDAFSEILTNTDAQKTKALEEKFMASTDALEEKLRAVQTELQAQTQMSIAQLRLLEESTASNFQRTDAKTDLHSAEITNLRQALEELRTHTDEVQQLHERNEVMNENINKTIEDLMQKIKFIENADKQIMEQLKVHLTEYADMLARKSMETFEQRLKEIAETQKAPSTTAPGDTADLKAAIAQLQQRLDDVLTQKIAESDALTVQKIAESEVSTAQKIADNNTTLTQKIAESEVSTAQKIADAADTFAQKLNEHKLRWPLTAPEGEIPIPPAYNFSAAPLSGIGCVDGTPTVYRNGEEVARFSSIGASVKGMILGGTDAKFSNTVEEYLDSADVDAGILTKYANDSSLYWQTKSSDVNLTKQFHRIFKSNAQKELSNGDIVGILPNGSIDLVVGCKFYDAIGVKTTAANTLALAYAHSSIYRVVRGEAGLCIERYNTRGDFLDSADLGVAGESKNVDGYTFKLLQISEGRVLFFCNDGKTLIVKKLKETGDTNIDLMGSSQFELKYTCTSFDAAYDEISGVDIVTIGLFKKEDENIEVWLATPGGVIDAPAITVGYIERNLYRFPVLNNDGKVILLQPPGQTNVVICYSNIKSVIFLPSDYKSQFSNCDKPYIDKESESTADVIYDANNGMFLSLEQTADGLTFVQVFDIFGASIEMQRTKRLGQDPKTPLRLLFSPRTDQFTFVYQKNNFIHAQILTNTGEAIVLNQTYKRAQPVSADDAFVFHTDNDDDATRHLFINWNADSSKVSIDTFDDHFGIPPGLFVGMVSSKTIAPGAFGEVALKGAIILTESLLPTRLIGKKLTINTTNPGAKCPFNLSVYTDQTVLIGTCISAKEIIIGN